MPVPTSLLRAGDREARDLPAVAADVLLGEQGVGHPGDVAGRGQVSGIVIAAIDNDALVPMQRVVILVADTMDAGNHRSAALAVHEVDSLPDTAIPGVVADGEGAGEFSAGTELIRSWFSYLRKVQYLIAAQAGLLFFNRFGQNYLASGLIDDGKFACGEIARNGGFDDPLVYPL